ncbi:hypothetical protein XA68_17822 [Ophiocordyceps unilateralis]|uniref:BZIP domain-containing protein n=1 Tax=Ophiocordyceps unilateralis TaxID=268505 RepID=A0A2A9P3Z9_OPHUN|nr:hypothetical protein XA68_17822 [Ophiocordyceps unilateralis]
MSQRGLAPHAASRRSSGSPAEDEEASSRQYVSRSGGSDGRGGTAGLGMPEAPGRIQHPPPKALGVHNILNPSEPRTMASESLGSLSSRRRESESMVGGHTARAYGVSRAFFPAQAGLGSHSAGGSTLTPLRRPSTSGQDVSTAAYLFSASSTPRETSSPKLPRGPVPHHEGEMRVPALASTTSPAKRPYEMESPEEPRPLTGHHPHTGRALAAMPLMATSPRMATTPHGRPHSLHAPRRFQPAVTPSRPLSVVAGGGDGPPPWSEVIRRSGMGGSMGGAEGQQAYMALPGSDTPIPVQVDYSQASKKADEKRQRNAKASTRHRRKRKMQQEDKDRQLQELKDERRQQQEEMEDVKRQRDFYRDERNRLRDIVARTATIHHHAQGPQSPSARSTGSQAERSPGQHGEMATPTQGYASDPSSVDRPMQRRRTEERPEFPAPAFGTSGGGPPPALAPLSAGAAYGAPQRPPSATSSGSVERLPPLRAMEGGPPGPVPAQEQDPRTGQWRPAQPRHYETGWATAGRRGFESQGPQWP